MKEKIIDYVIMFAGITKEQAELIEKILADHAKKTGMKIRPELLRVK